MYFRTRSGSPRSLRRHFRREHVTNIIELSSRFRPSRLKAVWNNFTSRCIRCKRPTVVSSLLNRACYTRNCLPASTCPVIHAVSASKMSILPFARSSSTQTTRDTYLLRICQIFRNNRLGEIFGLLASQFDSVLFSHFSL